ncbi:MAG: insulinase family protein [Alphaproteobacteria bacterium]|nr:insulinase family protein [Alphaproteobacteria bacterium]
MTQPDIKLTTLSNGLRIVTDRVPYVESVVLGVWAGVGTRNEDLSVNGAAHMVEHMLFKGTATRNAREIVEAIENVGGHMNAYTGREVTSYHIHLLKDDLPLALNVLADMVQHSTMLEEEIEQERSVILQEIGMCNDTPDDIIFDHYFETAYPEQALGAPILGTSEIVAAMNREALMSYVKRLYTPSRLVICASGNFDHDDFVRRVENAFTALPEGGNDNKKSASYIGGSERRVPRELEQSHIVLGFQGPSRTSNDYYTAKVLSCLLGGGMSSRLFQEVREKRGLVYSIYSFLSSYSDDGQFGIYAGTSPSQLSELVPVICDEILKLSDGIAEEELARAKAQLRSTTLLARESMMNRADQNARSLLLHGNIRTVKDIIEEINAVNISSLQTLSGKIFSSNPTLAALGPLETLGDFETVKHRLAVG